MTTGALTLGIPEELVAAIADQVVEKLAAQLPAGFPTMRADLGTKAKGRLAVRKAEAAEMLGVSYDYLVDHVLPDVRVVREGRIRLIPVTELERWLDQHASRALDGR